MFFSRLQEQDDDVAAWSHTITKLKQVLARCLVETGMLDASGPRRSTHPDSSELEAGIRENNDLAALAPFNCFR